jgi:hypothetical protein
MCTGPHPPQGGSTPWHGMSRAEGSVVSDGNALTTIAGVGADAIGRAAEEPDKAGEDNASTKQINMPRRDDAKPSVVLPVWALTHRTNSEDENMMGLGGR